MCLTSCSLDRLLGHRLPFHSRHLEAPELAPVEGRAAAEPLAVRLEHVDERRANGARVAQLDARDVERHARQRPDARLAARRRGCACARRGAAAARRPCARRPRPRRARPRGVAFRRVPGAKRPLPADGGRARPRAPRRRRLAVRAEVGRLPRRARERRRRARALEPQRAAAAALLPGAAAARRAASAPLRARRRDRDRPRRPARLRRDADAPAPGREPRSAGSPAEIPAEFVVFDVLLWDGEPVHELPLEERRARVEALDGFRLSPATRDRDGRARAGSTRSRRPGSTASSRSGSASPYLPGLARRRRQGEGAQDGRLRRRRRALEGEADAARDAAARPLPRRRRDRLRRLGRGRRAQARARSSSAVAAAARGRARPRLLRAEPLGQRRARPSRRCGPSSSPRCATTRCRATASATARGCSASAPTRTRSDCTWREVRPPRRARRPDVESLLAGS